MNGKWTVALIGAPYCGKADLFNSLTGLNQSVGSYHGTGVERKTGMSRSLHGKRIHVMDLPETYSLVPRTSGEQVTRDIMLGMSSTEEEPDLVLEVADVAGVERQMPLILQILELGLPTVLVLNHPNKTGVSGIRINIGRLSALLGGIPVLFSQANAGPGLVKIRHAIIGKALPVPGRLWEGDQAMEEALKLSVAINAAGRQKNAVLLLSDERFPEERSVLPAASLEELEERNSAYRKATGKNLAEEINLVRLAKAKSILLQVLTGGTSRKRGVWIFQAMRTLLHWKWGRPVFVDGGF